MMKNIKPILISSFVSALLAVLLYRVLESPREVIIREPVPARYVKTNVPSQTIFEEASPRYPSAAPTNFTEAAELVTPGVANINAIQGSGGLNFFRGNAIGSASGSGVVISPDGYIVTNNHVVEEGDEYRVTLNDNREFSAELIGTDPSTDLALLKIEAENLPYLGFGDSDSLKVGEWVLAVGNPFNLESTVTAGIVSAKGRSIDILEGQDRIESFIQTDAAVNPGNSGGALVNTQGALVGINTAIITRSGRYEGYSFAVPANLVKKVIRDLKDYGMVQRGLMGVFINEVDNRLAEELKLENVEGVYITRVTAGGGADEAGMKKGDVIVNINGVTTKTLPEMQEQVGRFRPGNTIQVEYIRKGRRYETLVTLKNKSNSTSLIHARDKAFLREIGFELQELPREEARELGNIQGVKVVSIYKFSKVEATNMEPDFIITKLNDTAIYGVDQFVRQLKAASGKVVLEGYYGNTDEPYYYSFDLEEE
ncbi:MAG TPA: trypsin-like peptidase domain-containing protein [Saprospiraceae bacterium]|nr:trypsin-like peptidase domain-containing protein [Saprospiraceae bacterium]